MISEKLSSHGISIKGELKGPYKIIIPLSGGKDSQACLKLALAEFEKSEILCVFCDTRFEHEITYKHVQNISKKSEVDIVTLNAGSVLEVCTKYKRFPGGGARHCTDELKIRPSKFFYKYLAEQQGGFEVWMGVRSQESSERAKRYEFKVSNELYAPHDFMPRKYPKYLEKLGVMFRVPVLEWSKYEVLDFLDGEENELYSHGFDRVGCFPCLASGEAWQMKAFHFDETGRKHFMIAEQISEIAGRDVLVTKKYAGQGPGCALCSI